MPSWLRKLLENGSTITKFKKILSNGHLVTDETVENETRGEIPVLVRLCRQDDSVQRAFFCDHRVRHVFKLSGEGGFCGYRNIQMLISYLKDTGNPAGDRFPERLPSIFELQDLIENAWALGFNSSGKAETGGIKGTRKYIGTPEVLISHFPELHYKPLKLLWPAYKLKGPGTICQPRHKVCD